jgi:ribosome modulation factor
MTIYTQGYTAGFNGMSLSSCPEFSEGALRQEWLRGFYAGRDRRETARTRRFR